MVNVPKFARDKQVLSFDFTFGNFSSDHRTIFLPRFRTRTYNQFDDISCFCSLIDEI